MSKKYIDICVKFKNPNSKYNGCSVHFQISDPNQLFVLLAHFDVAIMCNNTFYPVNEQNYQAQFWLMEKGVSPTISHDDNFEKERIECPTFPDSLMLGIFNPSVKINQKSF